MRLMPALMVPSLLLVTAVTGCHVTTHKNGNKENVDIGTPFGSMQVKTNDDASAVNLGMAPYPGAVLVKKHGDHDNGAADVNMSFGGFHLGVKAASFTTPDGEDKVLAFYRKELSKYGDVLQCDGNRAVGEPTRTSEGLTCNMDHKSAHININDGDDDDSHKIELRTGSKAHQHIVAVEKKDGGTKFGLVSLDLPTNFNFGDDKDKDKDSD